MRFRVTVLLAVRFLSRIPCWPISTVLFALTCSLVSRFSMWWPWRPPPVRNQRLSLTRCGCFPVYWGLCACRTSPQLILRCLIIIIIINRWAHHYKEQARSHWPENYRLPQVRCAHVGKGRGHSSRGRDLGKRARRRRKRRTKQRRRRRRHRMRRRKRKEKRIRRQRRRSNIKRTTPWDSQLVVTWTS